MRLDSPIALLPLLGFAVACGGNESEIIVQKRILNTSQLTFDAGMVAVNTREPLTLFLQSTGQGEVTIFDVQVDDPDHWVIYEDWATEDCDEDGVLDCQTVEGGGSEGDPRYAEPLTIAFAPDGEDEFRTVLTVISNDNEVAEQDEEGRGIWRVVLRGIGRYPCANIYPQHFDFGPSAPGGTFYEDGFIENCGVVTLTVSSFEVIGTTSAYVDTPTPLYVLPGGTEDYSIAYEPLDSAMNAEIGFVLNDPDFTETVAVVGNDCEGSYDPDWDDDGDGWWSCGGDCDDSNPNVNPEATEKDNGEDDDCDGDIDEGGDRSVDDDGDGFTEEEGDCHDHDDSIHPDATETVNQMDDDCNGRVDDGTEWSDDDGDGMSELQGDCDDTQVLVHPGAEEQQNEIDDDCDGNVDEGAYSFDDDADGYTELDDPQDCNDEDPWSFPGATEDCDGRDNDCDGVVDEGEDGSEDGACAFVVERIASAPPDSGCSTATVAAGGLMSFFAMGIAAFRRREHLDA